MRRLAGDPSSRPSTRYSEAAVVRAPPQVEHCDAPRPLARRRETGTSQRSRAAISSSWRGTDQPSSPSISARNARRHAVSEARLSPAGGRPRFTVGKRTSCEERADRSHRGPRRKRRSASPGTAPRAASASSFLSATVACYRAASHTPLPRSRPRSGRQPEYGLRR